MSNILEKICKEKLIELNERKKALSFDELYKQTLETQIQRPSFKEALKKDEFNRPAIIAELKKASPSQGLIRENFEHMDLALGLEKSGAKALSVLTEQNYFLGSDQYLIEVSKKVNIPTLRKDFIFDKYQICEAKIFGASAILLIVKMLPDSLLKDLYKFAKSLELDILVETHNEEEIKTAIELEADIVGINSRNLKDFTTNIDEALNFTKLLPNECVKVLESAIKDGRTLKQAGENKIDAVLIGTAFMSKESPSKELEKFLEEAK